MNGGFIAVIGLIVGGLGIMNIMMASIIDRIREIGIRRAVGATPFHIFVQVMIESVLLSSVGGVAGVFLGLGIMKFLVTMFPVDTRIAFGALELMISFGSAGNGSIAGIVARPLATLAYLRASTRIQLTDPDILLIYFYEGNDLNDNIEYLQKQAKSGKPFDNSQLQDHAYFQHYLNQSVLQQEALYQRSIDPRWYQQLYLGKFIVHASAALAVNLPHLIDPEKKDEEQAGRSPLNPPGRYSWTEPGHINHARINDSDVSLPDTVQGPSMDLDEQEKNDALVSFRESLHFLKQALPNTRVVVVYLPSVISCYAITSPQVSVQSHARRHHFVFDTPQMREQSDWIALQIGNVSRSEQAGFIDAREAIRSAAQREPVHGPLDWNHFNQAGYKALASAIIPDLKGWLATP